MMTPARWAWKRAHHLIRDMRFAMDAYNAGMFVREDCWFELWENGGFPVARGCVGDGQEIALILDTHHPEHVAILAGMIRANMEA